MEVFLSIWDVFFSNVTSCGLWLDLTISPWPKQSLTLELITSWQRRTQFKKWLKNCETTFKWQRLVCICSTWTNTVFSNQLSFICLIHFQFKRKLKHLRLPRDMKKTLINFSRLKDRPLQEIAEQGWSITKKIPYRYRARVDKMRLEELQIFIVVQS